MPLVKGRKTPTRSTGNKLPANIKAAQTTRLARRTLSMLHRPISKTSAGKSRLNQISTPTDQRTIFDGGMNPCAEKMKRVDNSPPSSKYQAFDPAADLA